MNYGLVFPFSEINTAVFQNAAIYHRMQTHDDTFTVFAPREILSCYFHAKQKVELIDLPFENYSEVSNYSLRQFSKNNPMTWISAQVLSYSWQRLSNKLPRRIFRLLPPYFQADYKMRRYLYRSGIYLRVRRWCKQHKLHFLGPAHHTDLEYMRMTSRGKGVDWDLRFRQLERMILTGAILRKSEMSEEFLKLQSTSSESERHVIASLKSIIDSDKKVFWVRTRNISGAASVHNTDAQFLLGIVRELLVRGFVVINAGTPTVRLGVSHDNLFEFDHNLPVIVQQYLASKCTAVITSAEAGLFVAWAAAEIPLITFGMEWSVQHTVSQVSLLSARKKIGIRDFSLGQGNIQQFCLLIDENFAD